ncbi:hypothetical protein P3S67_009505 [Capsicum chacoense]
MIESRESEEGVSNENILVSSPNEVETMVEVELSKKERSWNRGQDVGSGLTRLLMEKPKLRKHNDYLRTSPCEDGTKACTFVSEDWENVRIMVKFLKTFYNLTLKVFGSKYVTNNVHFVEIAELDLILKEMIENENSKLKKLATNMREKFRKDWGTQEKMNKMIFISSVLDPRNKLEYVPFAIMDMFGKEIGDKLSDSVESYMKALFEHYCNKSELGKYLAKEIESDLEQFDILGWWKVNEPRFPILAEMARDVLAIPISSVASECAFSTGGRVIDPFRSSLTPKLVQSLICLQDWLRSESNPVNIEEDLEYLEKFEVVFLALNYVASW